MPCGMHAYAVRCLLLKRSRRLLAPHIAQVQGRNVAPHETRDPTATKHTPTATNFSCYRAPRLGPSVAAVRLASESGVSGVRLYHRARCVHPFRFCCSCSVVSLSAFGFSCAPDPGSGLTRPFPQDSRMARVQLSHGARRVVQWHGMEPSTIRPSPSQRAIAPRPEPPAQCVT